MESFPSKILVREMTVYFGIFKEPRGLIRLLQFFFAIFAFATACNGGSDLIIGDSIEKDRISASWSYPYDLKYTPINTDLTKTQDNLSKTNSIRPSAEFFVFTGVTSMLYTFAFLVVYVLCDRQYRNDERLPTIDFIFTLIGTIFWIAGSSAWGQGVSDLRSQTSIDYITGLVTGCTNGTEQYCPNYESGTYANVTVSVIFGFLNFLLWAASVWFIYKETRFFKSRNAQQQQPPPLPNNFSNISPPVPNTMT